MRGWLRRLLAPPPGGAGALPEPVPDVVLDVAFEDGLLYLVLENLGAAHAHDVAVAFDRELWGVEGSREFSALELFTDLAFLPAGKRISVFLDTSAALFERETELQWSFDVRFRDAQGRPFSLRLRHNLAIYRALGYIRRG